MKYIPSIFLALIGFFCFGYGLYTFTENSMYYNTTTYGFLFLGLSVVYFIMAGYKFGKVQDGDDEEMVKDILKKLRNEKITSRTRVGGVRAFTIENKEFIIYKVRGFSKYRLEYSPSSPEDVVNIDASVELLGQLWNYVVENDSKKEKSRNHKEAIRKMLKGE